MAGKTPRNEKSLVCFIQAFVGTTVVVERSRRRRHQRELEHRDDDMHCTLTNAIRVTPEGYKSKLERVYVRSRMIRFVHFAPSINPSEFMEQKRLDWFNALETLR